MERYGILNFLRASSSGSIKNLLRGILVLMILLTNLFIVSKGQAQDWYVDNTATGSNSGTSWSTAWQSFAAVNWGSLNPGDNLYISGGESSKTYSEQLSIGASGSPGSPITIRVGQSSPHDGIVILEGSTTYGIDVYNKSWITISGQLGDNETPNMIVRNHNDDEMRLSSITGIIVEYLEVGPNVNDECIYLVNGYIGGSNRIHHNKVHSCYDYHILVRAAGGTVTHDDYLRIDHNEIYNLGHDGIHGDADANGITIDHNDIHTAASGPNQNPVYVDGMHLRGFKHVTVSHNKIYNLEGPDSMWAYLYFEADTTRQSNVAANDMYIYNNVIYETEHSYSHNNQGISFGCKACTSLRNVSIVNNTIVDTESIPINFGTFGATTVSNVIIANNILYNGHLNRAGSERVMLGITQLNTSAKITTGSFDDRPIPDIIWDYNLVSVVNNDPIIGLYGTGNGKRYSYSRWKKITGFGSNDVTGDPVFVKWRDGTADDLHLSVTDTASRSRGLILPGVNDDHDGTHRSTNRKWDIGAYESNTK